MKRRAYWLYLQAFFANQAAPKPQAKSTTIHIPKKNVLRKRTIQLMRVKKADILKQLQPVIQHHD